jgi:hypothetical protein
MIPAAEVRIQRKLTTDFIEADALEIQLLRAAKTDNGSGGYEFSDPAPVGGLQRFRLIPLQDGTTERYDANGKQVFPQYMLMGQFDADMERWDVFELNGDRYQIVHINQNRQYETKGEVAYLGAS